MSTCLDLPTESSDPEPLLTSFLPRHHSSSRSIHYSGIVRGVMIPFRGLRCYTARSISKHLVPARRHDTRDTPFSAAVLSHSTVCASKFLSSNFHSNRSKYRGKFHSFSDALRRE